MKKASGQLQLLRGFRCWFAQIGGASSLNKLIIQQGRLCVKHGRFSFQGASGAETGTESVQREKEKDVDNKNSTLNSSHFTLHSPNVQPSASLYCSARMPV